MPNTKSAKKRLRQNIVRNRKNLSAKRDMRTQLRKVREAVAKGDIDLAETEFKIAAQKLDKASSGKIIHQNSADRLKSRLSAKIKAMKIS